MDTSVLSREEDPPLDDNTVRKMLTEAVQKVQKDELTEAILKLDEIIVGGSSNFNLLAGVYMWYGRIYRNLGVFDKAYFFFKKEIQMHSITSDTTAVRGAFRRIMDLSVKMGNLSKAKAKGIELVELATDENDLETIIETRLIIANMLMDSAAKKTDEVEISKLLKDAKNQIEECHVLEIQPIINVAIQMAEAKYEAMIGNLKKSYDLYDEIIETLHESEDFSRLHQCYFEKSQRCYPPNINLPIVDNLRSAIFYAQMSQNPKSETIYTIELAHMLSQCQRFGEARVSAKKSLEMSRNLKNDELILNSILAVADALIGLRKIEKAAYFLVFGSILALSKNKEEILETMYRRMDKIMKMKKMMMKEETTEVEVLIDGSDDSKQSENESTIIKIEHTTTIETWKITINDIVEAKKRRNEELAKKKEEQTAEPMDFMDMIFKMNNRMDEQRAVLPQAAVFAKPQPLSMKSKKKGISQRFLPGLRGWKNDMKLDKKSIQRLLKLKSSSSKSKLSMNSQNLETGDDYETSTICSTSTLASYNSNSFNKENQEATETTLKST